MADQGTSVREARRQLLPRWVLYLSLLAVLSTLVVVVLQAVGALNPDSFDLKLLGIAYADLTRPTQLVSHAFVLALGVAGVGLLRGDAWALSLASALSIVGILVAPSIIEFYEGGFRLRFDPLIFVAVLVALERRRSEWREQTMETLSNKPLQADRPSADR